MSSKMPSLRAALCRSKYSAIVKVIEENGEVRRPASSRISAAAANITFAQSSSSRVKAAASMTGSRRNNHEREGETYERNDANYKAFRMAIMSVISASQDGEKALKSQLMWIRLPQRSSCNPIIMTGHRYLMFGDVSPDGKAFVTACNLIHWDTMTASEKDEIQRFVEKGLRCR
jgi:hypothetical protein